MTFGHWRSSHYDQVKLSGAETNKQARQLPEEGSLSSSDVAAIRFGGRFRWFGAPSAHSVIAWAGGRDRPHSNCLALEPDSYVPCQEHLPHGIGLGVALSDSCLMIEALHSWQDAANVSRFARAGCCKQRFSGVAS